MSSCECHIIADFSDLHHTRHQGCIWNVHTLTGGCVMGICEVCGNNYDKAFTVTMGHREHVFDSFECAIRVLSLRSGFLGFSRFFIVRIFRVDVDDRLCEFGECLIRYAFFIERRLQQLDSFVVAE